MTMRNKIRDLQSFFRDIKYWFLYRFHPEHKYHLVRTGLNPGYHEVEDRLLHASFSLLVEFVEKQQAGMYRCFHDEKLTDREAGLANLEWQTKLVYNEDHGVDPSEAQYGELTDQAIAAITTRDLYLWWLDDRPKRHDPWDYVPDIPKGNDLKEYLTQRKETPGWKDAADAAWAQEEAWHDEDAEMLTRLIEIRRSLWT